MEVKQYDVTCLNCKGSDRLKITQNNTVFFTKHIPIIAARFRPDLKWGFECQCGNDSRLAYEEKDQTAYLTQGDSVSIKRLTRLLKPKNELRFKMEAI